MTTDGALPRIGSLSCMNADTETSIVAAGRQAYDAEIRTLAYAMINSFLAQHAIMTEAVAMRPAKLLVYLVIVASTVQRVMRGPDLSRDVRSGAHIPSSRVGHVSRRAIAAATGLPNENVRRIVNELIDEGLVIAVLSRGVRSTEGVLQNPRVRAALHDLFVENVRTYQTFLKAGVIDHVKVAAPAT